MTKKRATAKDGAKAPDDELLEKLLAQFREAEEQTREERTAAERDRDYYDLKQHTEDEIAALEKRGQPVVTTSRLKSKIDSLLGYEKRGRTDPKAYPRTPQHEKDADAATDALRFVCDQNRFQTITSNVAENLFLEGVGACTVTVAQVNGEPDVRVTWVPWDRYYRDPHSRDRHFADKKFDGIVLWYDEDDILDMFPGSEAVIEHAYSCSTEGDDDTFQDRPKFTWADKARKRVRVMVHVVCSSGSLPGAPSGYA